MAGREKPRFGRCTRWTKVRRLPRSPGEVTRTCYSRSGWAYSANVWKAMEGYGFRIGGPSGTVEIARRPTEQEARAEADRILERLSGLPLAR